MTSVFPPLSIFLLLATSLLCHRVSLFPSLHLYPEATELLEKGRAGNAAYLSQSELGAGRRGASLPLRTWVSPLLKGGTNTLYAGGSLGERVQPWTSLLAPALSCFLVS